MKFYFPLFAANALAAAITGPDFDKRQISLVREVIANISAAVVALNESTTAFIDYRDGPAIRRAARTALQAVQQGSVNIRPSDPLPIEEASSLDAPIYALGNVYRSTSTNIIRKKDLIVVNCGGPIALRAFTQQRDAIIELRDVIKSKIPTDLYTVADQLAQRINSTLTRGITAYANETTFPAFCYPSTTTTTTTTTTTVESATTTTEVTTTTTEVTTTSTTELTTTTTTSQPPVTTTAPPNVCVPGALVAGTSCTQECDTTRPGGDIRAIKVASLTACAEACAAEARCVTAQFRKNNSYCYLKSTINAAKSSTIVDGVICRATGPFTTTTTLVTSTTTTTSQSPATSSPSSSVCVEGAVVAGTSCTQECDTTRPGGDIKAIRVASLIACAEACAAESQCVTAQFRKTNSFCYLKSTVNAAKSSTIVDGVVCPPTAPLHR